MDEESGQWIRPRENTVEALVYGMNQCDGVELDSVSYTHLTLPPILLV